MYSIGILDIMSVLYSGRTWHRVVFNIHGMNTPKTCEDAFEITSLRSQLWPHSSTSVNTKVL